MTANFDGGVMANHVEFKNISKAFIGVQALENISFRADGGEVCALLGENGAGKSTLLKILSGAYHASSGQYFINGQEVKFNAPVEALRAGVSIIYQERQLFRDLSVTENIFTDSLHRGRLGLVNFGMCHSEVQELINLFHMPFSPNTKVNTLSVAHQQMVEIMKAYRRNSTVIAFDEPTASLSDSEIDILFSLIEKLRKEGKVILYVSHRLQEIFRITDKIIILKDGCFVDSLKTKDADEDHLISKMVGRSIGDVFSTLSRNDQIGEDVLDVRHLNNEFVHDVSFTLRKGEVLGVAGLVGAGRSETIRAIFGADKLDSGEVYVDGKLCKIKNPKDAIDAGIGVCPEDRKEQGLVLERSIQDNLTIPILKILSKIGVIDRKRERELSKQAVDKYRIKTTSADKLVMELSGGNQQKVILGRWLLTKLKVLILDEPTKGIDVGAKAEVYQMICDLAKSGLGVVFISSELPEVIGLSDRVIVMCGGRVSGELKREELSEERILRLAMGKR
jgi:ABC-type sugar transport system ATPase subunit